MPLDDSFLIGRIEGAARAVRSLATQIDAVRNVCESARACLSAGGRIYTCGNGGSAAEAMHLAEELIGKYREARRPLPAVCLNADPTALTCIANDFGFEEVFARQIAALGARGDALIAFSTSGESENIVRGLRAARAGGVRTIGLLGRGGGRCLGLCDAAVVVKSDDTAHVQEAHLALVHLILEAVEGPG